MVFVCLLYVRPCIEFGIRKNKHGLCLSGTFGLTGGPKINNHANAYVISNLGSAIGRYVIYHSEEWPSLGNQGVWPWDTPFVLRSEE